MFRGVNQVNLDAKGRLAIPARYRDQISVQCSGHMVLTIDTEERCLLLYPIDDWEEIQEKVNALPSFNPAARRLQRLLIGHATDLDMDGNGRLLIPSLLREYAGLDKKVILLGQGRKFELWDEGAWNETREEYLQIDDASGNFDGLQDLSL
ncbi:division/cell wall cluster transcriptional repressor MraZ [Neptunomonas phycophila]|uniref:division/cell wall cluster transcriptional repressor MraZ n=1 Tax=Neptunomonas phycophila TaxID=1572645 RepID=UPI001BE8CA4F|nr:division/cell wall cluster transcriptional repressor MraZ [Neptunomonas phycophila]MBT3144097.1 division/cell wall cluster transcriptional repressor MraZ [Neptunomonas phycophila]MDO6782728.1 division/cell wall cluster transcriptional repressor MraZ [Neptunomonas phycophila]